MIERRDCRTCGGVGVVTDFLCTGTTMTCYDCGGVGVVDRDPEWEKQGAEARVTRILAGRSLREEARLRGVSILQLASHERGRRDRPW